MKGKRDLETVMVLPSYSFIFIFLPLVVVLYFFVNKYSHTFGKVILLAASLVYYALIGMRGFAALIVSILANYFISALLTETVTRNLYRKILLALGIIIDIGALMYCKYLLYFETLFNKYTGSNLTFTAIVLPLGISYFTFSQIAYLVDTYRDKNAKASLLDYALFVAFFPKVTVGPIALSGEMIPQFNDEKLKTVNYDNMAKGMYGFVLGLSKKLILADNIGIFVDFAYSNISTLGSTNAFLAIVLYSFQIYFDFSGYCDMALGIAKMLNMDIPDNFDAPYRSLSIAEFWKRWHITLTRFFRNYLYIPLGGNRKGKLRTYLNTMIIFVVSGLWHGAATNFILWGAIHGIGSIVSKVIKPFMEKVPKAVRWFLTFAFVSLAWVYFRAPDLKSANDMLSELFTGGIVPMDINIVASSIPTEGKFIQWIILNINQSITYYSGCVIMLILFALSFYFGTFAKTVRERVRDYVPTKGKIVTTVILFAWCVVSLSEITQFIYVNF